MSHVFAMNGACPESMRIFKNGEARAAAPEGISTGPFLVQLLLSSQVDGEMTAMRAFVPPGTRTNWHSHPRGQLLFVIEGAGLVQREGDERVTVQAGDAVWFAPNERHWHGATSDSSFGYLSVQPVKDGSAVHWFGPVEPKDGAP